MAYKKKLEKNKTSWENVNSWYDKIVGKEGHYYHRTLIIPNVLKMIEEGNVSSLLDLACGQGVLGRCLPKGISYTGIDLSQSLIQTAKKHTKHHTFKVGDITKPLFKKEEGFDCVTVILALQDLKDLKGVFENAYHALNDTGRLILVINHPCFRIPRQTHWGVDEKQWIQYRRVDKYLSNLEIPIKIAPSKEARSPEVSSFHRPISYYSQKLYETGFAIARMQEWVSDKLSTGGRARMENRARKEFPLFLSLECVKNPSFKP